MTHYSNSPNMVRVDYFKKSGKWYETLELNMDKGWDKDLLMHDGIRKAMKEQGLSRSEFFAVILDPYHENSYPVMLIPGTY